MAIVDEPFNLWNILVNEISGDIWIFIFISCAAIFYFAAKFRMPNNIAFMIIILWIVIISIFYPPLMIVAIITTALLISWNIARYLTR